MKSARFQIMMIATMFFIFFIFTRAALAQTSAYALSAPSVQADYTGPIGTLYISEASYPNSLKNGDTLSISLPTSVVLQTIQIQETASNLNTATITLDKANRQFTVSDLNNVGGAVYNYGSFSYMIDGHPATKLGKFSIQVTDDNRFSIMVNKGFTDGSSYYKFMISFQSVYIKPLGPNDPTAITAVLDAPPSSGFSTGSYTLANVAVRGTIATVDAPLSTASNQTYIVPVLGQDGGKVAPIIIKETAPGSLAVNTAGSGTVYLALPPGFTWNRADIIQDWGFSANDSAINGPDVTAGITTDTSGQSIISLVINRATTGCIGRITVNGSVSVDSSVAQPGDILVSYYGTNPGVDGATLTVGTYATNGVTASQETTTDVIAGRLDQKIGQFSIQEQTPGDLPQGRTVTFTLPSGAKWHTIPTVVRQAGDGELEFERINSDKDRLTFIVKKTSTVRSYYVFKYGSVDLAIDNPDTLSITVGGAAGATGNEIVANIIQPLTLTIADKPTVNLGVKNQRIGDITICETSAGALRAKDTAGNQAALTIKLPSGVIFSNMPMVKVSGGNVNLAVSQIGLDSTGRLLTIPIEQSSSLPSTITISDIQVDLDRTLPEGDLKLEISGTAISETCEIFDNSWNKTELVVASCGTSAGGSTAAVFTIDKASYTVNGQEVAMDTAPYIKNGRTMVPLRFAANAVGVNDADIFWDGGANMVTLMKGDRVVQMQIGNKVMQINGVAVATDAAPEISDGRTMLPIRALGMALGASLQWNEADRTVTVSLN